MEIFIAALKVFVILTCWPVLVLDKGINAVERWERCDTERKQLTPDEVSKECKP